MGENGPSFLSKILGSKKEIVAGMGFLTALGGAGTELHAQTKADKAFDELDAEVETQEVTESGVAREKASFKDALTIVTGGNAEKTKIIMESLEKALSDDIIITPADKMSVIKVYREKLEGMQKAKSSDKKSGLSTIHQNEFGSTGIDARSGALEKEMENAIEGFDAFFSSTVNYKQAMEALTSVVKDGETAEYNGAKFWKKGDKFYMMGTEITEQTRPILLKDFKRAQEDVLKKLGQ